jgi:serine/threonine protein kinase
MARFTFDIDTHGEGGFAKVRQGMDNELERAVAVKVLNQIATELTEPEQERFRARVTFS